MKYLNSLVILSLFLAGTLAFAEKVIDSNTWSGTSTDILEIGRLVRIEGEFEDAGIYYPPGSILRVLQVAGSHSIPAANLQFADIQRGFRATVTLGPAAPSTNRRIVTFQCMKEIRRIGMGSREEAEFFDCNYGFLTVLPRNTRVYSGN